MIEAETATIRAATVDDIDTGLLADVVASSRPAWQGAYRAFRNFFDIAVAGTLLVAIAPLLAVIAVAVKLDSAGPVFFWQQRVGLHGRPFSIVKFRTMCVGAPKYSEKIDDKDPRVTAVGRFLRRTGLDELPQLVNVVRGEMALIGPRPEQVALLHHYQPWQLRRHSVKPGISGWWQVHHRGRVHIYDDVAKDLEYIDRQGPLIDLLVVVMTLKVLVTGILSRSGDRVVASTR